MNNVDLRLHDQIRLSLVGASQRDVQTVMRSSGATEDASGKSFGSQVSDVEIFFLSQAITSVSWAQLGENDAFYDAERFAISAADVDSKVEVVLPTTPGSEPFRLVCPSGIRRLPLLRSMLNGKCVDRQMLGVHGTAFTFADRGYLVCGWPRGGKTGMLLSYLLHGAEYLAAEWIYVSDQGRTMHGVPEPMRLRPWHLHNDGKRFDHVGLGDRVRLLGTRAAAFNVSLLAPLVEALFPGPGRSLRKLASAMDRRQFVDKPAGRWLGKTLHQRAARLNIILLVGTHDAEDIRVTRLNAEVAKRRLLALQDEDLSDLRSVYRRWNYARSEASDWLAGFEQKRSSLVDQLIEGKAVYAVEHSNAVSLDALFYKLESEVK